MTDDIEKECQEWLLENNWLVEGDNYSFTDGLVILRFIKIDNFCCQLSPISVFDKWANSVHIYFKISDIEAFIKDIKTARELCTIIPDWIFYEGASICLD